MTDTYLSGSQLFRPDPIIRPYKTINPKIQAKANITLYNTQIPNTKISLDRHYMQIDWAIEPNFPTSQKKLIQKIFSYKNFKFYDLSKYSTSKEKDNTTLTSPLLTSNNRGPLNVQIGTISQIFNETDEISVIDPKNVQSTINTYKFQLIYQHISLIIE